ncbi:hypothetical protein VTP01DRAFT_7130 [Rhizomucor pusillus]|uniref:uncharacterized protein n=1 Tax=Rhizomucor pusillus TaxID=4840 RepID=UPI0037442A9B
MQNTIATRGQKLDIHTLLSNLNLLKRLKVHDSVLDTTNEAKQSHAALVNLEIVTWHVDVTTLFYISEACSSIKHLTVINIHVESNRTNCVEIYLSQCALDTCLLENICRTNNLARRGPHSKHIGLLNLTQLNKPNFRRCTTHFGRQRITMYTLSQNQNRIPPNLKSQANKN